MPIKRQLKRQTCIFSKTEQGYILIAPKHKGLVLSGGGSKGIAYIGMVKSMYEQGFIEQLTHVSGASAGAMAASLIALGMTYESGSKLINGISIFNMLDVQGSRLRAKGERFRNLFEIIYMQQIKEHLRDVTIPKDGIELSNYKIIKQKINLYESSLAAHEITINNFEDIVELGNSRDGLKKLDHAFDALPKVLKNQDNIKIENPRITFADLIRLRSLFPPKKQHLIKDLSIVTTNQTRRTLEFHNALLSANDSIAEIVMQSSAHPLLFSSAINEEGEYIADGGILENMPAIALIQAGLVPEEILCVKVESRTEFQARKDNARNPVPEAVSPTAQMLDNIAEVVLGGRMYERRVHTRNNEKIFYNLDNMLFLDSGTITAITGTPSVDQKMLAIEKAYQSTNELLDSHIKVFDNPLLAMIYLSSNQINQMLFSKENDDELFNCAGLAKGIFLLQESVSTEINNGEFRFIVPYINQIDDLIKRVPELNRLQQEQILSLCLKQINFYTEGKLEYFISQQVKQEQDVNKIGWFTYILDLLLKPIEWVFSLPEDKKPKEIKLHIIEKACPEQVISPRKIFSFFSTEAEDQVPADDSQTRPKQ